MLIALFLTPAPSRTPLPQKNLSASSSFLGHILAHPSGQRQQTAVPRSQGQYRQFRTQPEVSASAAEDAPVVVITGASRGIGKAVALHFGAKGAKVRVWQV